MKRSVTMIIAIVIFCLLFPLVLTGMHTIIHDANIADFTGLAQFAAITPLLLWLAAGSYLGWLTYGAVKHSRRKKSRRSM